MTSNFNINIHDLQYILRQIKIAEDHAGGKTLLQAIMDGYGVTASNATQLPAGLRTVDGRDNSLYPGLEGMGAADEIFPRLLAQVSINEQDEGIFQGISNTNHGAAGNVVDSDPRIISNLIVNQTAGNPAAVMAALQFSVFSEALLPGQVAATAQAIATAYANRLANGAAADGAQAAEVVAAAALEVVLLANPGAAAALVIANAQLLAAQNALAAATALSNAADIAAIVAQMAEEDASGLVDAEILEQADAVDALALANGELAAAQTDYDNAVFGGNVDAIAAALLGLDAETLEQAAAAAALVAANNELAAAQTLLFAATTTSNTADAAATAAQGVETAASALVDAETAEQPIAANANTAVATAQGVLAAATAASDLADAATLNAVLESYGIEVGPEGGLVIPNLSPDIGLSPGFNAWMTVFGQFFDHGLDLVTKGGNGTVYVPLQADDPLIAGADEIFGTADDLPAHLRFMALTRLDTAIDLNNDGDTTDAGETGITSGQNTTTAFVDQNQTYTSHASHQVFLREYVMTANGAVSTGHLLDGQAANGSLDGAIGNWAEVKAQALEMLGIKLTDYDIGNVPWLRTDGYGKFIPGANGYAQVITGLGADLKINTADDVDRNASGTIDATDFDINNDGVINGADLVANDHNGNTYDNEMLESHMTTGDGRGNENIALTTVHSIFHSERNRLIEANKATLIENATTAEGLAFPNEWLRDDVTSVPLDLNTLVWDGERLFQAARFSTEMQYQHMVFEEFARRVQPMADPFTFNNSPEVDASILAEFAHTVYRFGHSMLTDTVDRLDNSLQYLNGDDSQATLIAAFLNPQMYIGSGATLEEANGNIIRA